MPSTWCFAWALSDLLCRGQHSKTTHCLCHIPRSSAHTPSVTAANSVGNTAAPNHTHSRQCWCCRCRQLQPPAHSTACLPVVSCRELGHSAAPSRLTPPLRILLRTVDTPVALPVSWGPVSWGPTLLQGAAAVDHTPSMCCNFDMLPAVSCCCCCCGCCCCTT